MPGRLVDGPRRRGRSRSPPRDEVAVGSISSADAGRHVLGALGVRRQRRLGDAALATDLEAAGERGLGVPPLARGVLVVGVHPEFASGPVADRRRLAPVIGVRVGADEQPYLLELEFDLLHRPLELRHRSRLVHPGVDQHDPWPGRDRPGVAVRDARPGQRQPQPPQPGQDPLPVRALAGAPSRRTILTRRRLRRADAHYRRDRQALLRGARRPRPRRRRRLLGSRRLDRLVGAEELIAPDGIRRYFGALFAAFPDFKLEVIELTTARGRTAVRWRRAGHVRRAGEFQGFVANGARMTLEGCDVVTVQDGLIAQRRLHRQR